MPKHKTFFVAFAAALGFSAAVANAADIAPAAYDWTGFYIGVNAGAAWNNTEVVNDTSCPDGCLVGIDELDNDLTADDTVFTGGAIVGYNWQMENIVLGVEGDINYLGFSADQDRENKIGGGSVDGSYKVSFEADWYGTLRGRLGFAADNLLFYGTGGLAFGHLEAKSEVSAVDPGPPSDAVFGKWNGSVDDVNWGWTIGAGLEYGIDNWSLGLEYLYVDLGDADWDTDSSSGFDADLSYTEGSVDYQFSVVRATAKLRF